MLTITDKDLAVPGIHAWRHDRPRRSAKVLVISWPDLVLISPRVEWPEGIDLTPLLRKEESARIVRHPGFAKLLITTGVPVTDIGFAEIAKRGSLLRFTVPPCVRGRGRMMHGRALLRQHKGKRECFISRKTVKRLTSAIEQPMDGLDFRLFPHEVAPFFIVYRYKKPRAIVLPESSPK